MKIIQIRLENDRHEGYLNDYYNYEFGELNKRGDYGTSQIKFDPNRYDHIVRNNEYVVVHEVTK